MNWSLTAPGSPPRDVRARPVSSSTVVVQWNEPEIPNGVIRVCQSTSSSFIKLLVSLFPDYSCLLHITVDYYMNIIYLYCQVQCCQSSIIGLCNI